MIRADLLIHGASEVVTCHDDVGGPKCGPRAMNDVGVIPRGAIAIRAGKIIALGPETELKRRVDTAKMVNVRGRSIVPGLVEAHTHPVFARTRDGEFAARCRGADYEEILKAGGGIHASAEALRATTEADLVSQLLPRLDAMLRHGIVAAETKSGYGLTTESELKSLRAIKRANRQHAMELIPTFLGAHVVPTTKTRKRYVDEIVKEMLPRVARGKLATFCDVFVERSAFRKAEAEHILRAARKLGLGLKLHVDQFRDGGGATLAAKLGATSADHCDGTGPAGISRLARAGVIPVLLPAAHLFTCGRNEDAPRANARRMIDEGCAVALSTDFNPGTSPTENLPLVAALGCAQLGMTPEESLNAVTRNAAAATGVETRFGSLAKGRRAHFVVLDAPSYVHMSYRLGAHVVRDVYINGRRVVDRGRIVNRPRANASPHRS